MLRLQCLSSSFLPTFNPELSPETLSNPRLCTLNFSRPLPTLTTTRKPTSKCQYSWNTQQHQQSAFEPAPHTDSLSPQSRAGGTSFSLSLPVSCFSLCLTLYELNCFFLPCSLFQRASPNSRGFFFRFFIYFVFVVFYLSGSEVL